MALAAGGLASGFLGLGGGAGVKGIMKAIMPKTPGSNSPLPLPQPPDANVSAEQGAANAKRKKGSASQSIYTSPLGVGGEAQIARKTLLGQ